MAKYILSLDAGTTSSRAILFDHQANIVSQSQIEFNQIFPKPGWVEHDPHILWESQVNAAKDCIHKANVQARDIAGIGITNQRETTLIWDRQTGEPVYNAIVWQDRRTSDVCEKLKSDGWEALIHEKTGLVIDAYFSATKIQWILNRDKQLKKRALKGELVFGTVDSWLVWKLSGGKVHVTDVSNASRTMLFDIHKLQWDEHLVRMFDIPMEIFPEVKSNSEVIAYTEKSIFGDSIPVSGVLGDQQAALFGQMCFKPGMVKNTYGTGSFIVMNTGFSPVKSDNHLLTTVAWQLEGKTSYALEGSIFTTGAVVQWLRDQLKLIKTSDDIERLAACVENNGGVFFVPAFTGLGTPHWDQFARGTIFGLTRGSSDSHIARAALESIAFQTYDVMKVFENESAHRIDSMKVDGGASKNNLLMQIQSNVIQRDVIRPKNIETTALGAAYMAGLNVNFWKNLHELEQLNETERVFSPELDFSVIEHDLTFWHRAVNRAKNWLEF